MSATRLEERAQLAQEQATRRVQRLVAELREEGYDCVVVSICKLIQEGDECALPGASTVDACTRRIGPALPREAETLRSLADTLDKAFAKLDCKEATEGYRRDLPRQERT